jgi:hypothetical protein
MMRETRAVATGVGPGTAHAASQASPTSGTRRLAPRA